MTLVDMGMVSNIEYNPQDDTVVLMLDMPFFIIPQIVKDYLTNGLSRAITNAGAQLQNVNLAQMTEEECWVFFPERTG